MDKEEVLENVFDSGLRLMMKLLIMAGIFYIADQTTWFHVVGVLLGATMVLAGFNFFSLISLKLLEKNQKQNVGAIKSDR